MQMNKLNFNKYTYKDKVRREIQETVKIYSDLTPMMEMFTFNDGVQRNLVALTGTIKVYYINSTYNIPICIYLTESHPYQAPLAYVRPTSSMKVSPTSSVDPQGRVVLPYLVEWTGDKSDLQGLLSIMQIEFGERCPVFSKPAQSQYPQSQNVTNSYPYPSYPSYQAGGIGSGWSNSPTTYPIGNMSSSTPYIPGVGNPSAYNQSSVETQALTNSSWGAGRSNSLIDDNVVKMSLLSAVEDKVHRSYGELFAQNSAELDVQDVTNKELKKGSDAISRILEDIRRESANIQRVEKDLIEENNDLTMKLSSYQNEVDRGIDYDEVVEGSAPLYRQLFSLYVEEQSIEDALFFIGEAIGKGVIDIDTFLKKIRELSRKQFILRATIKKCREKAGLPEV